MCTLKVEKGMELKMKIVKKEEAEELKAKFTEVGAVVELA